MKDGSITGNGQRSGNHGGLPLQILTGKGSKQTGNHRGLPQRKTIRLQGYDYSWAGFYFITICTQNRFCLFGEIENGEMVLNDAGMMINTIWHELPVYYHECNIHEFVVMPNHVHGIIQIISNPNPVGATPCGCPDNGPCACPDNDYQPTNGQPTIGQPRGIAPTDIGGERATIGQPRGGAPTMSLSDIVHRFKTLTTKRYTDGVKNNDWPRFNKKL